MAVTARQNEHQTTHYIRFNLAWNTASASAVQLSMGSALPANALVLGTTFAVQTAFNGTTPTVDVGTAAAPTALVSGQAATAVGVTRIAPATLGGIVSSSADTELFVRLNYSGTPSAGAGVVVVEYVPNV